MLQRSHLLTAFSCGLALFLTLAFPRGGATETLSTFGTPGLIDTPNAAVLPDGKVALTTSHFQNNQRHTLAFQILPKVYGSFRYSVLRDLVPSGSFGGDVFDRSFDLHIQLLDEQRTRPALAFGLRDIAGTSIFSSEYIVATKSLGSTLELTAGLGWGRLAQRGSFSNPLSLLSSRFNDRAARAATGQLVVDAFFQGPVALFGGAEVRLSDTLSFQVEYSSDAYDREQDSGNIEIVSPINLGLTYSLKGGSQVRGFLLGGTTLGVQYSFAFDPAKRRVPGGRDIAPLPFAVPHDSVQGVQSRLHNMLKAEGLVLQGLSIGEGTTQIWVENVKWDVEAQAVGRAARVLVNVLPETTHIFVLTFQKRGVPNSSVTLRRSDFTELATDYDGAWRSLSRARIRDATARAPLPSLPDAFPVLDLKLSPYLALSFFDPDQPVRADVGIQTGALYRPAAGFTFSGIFRYPLAGNIDEATRVSDSILPRVRSDAVLFAQESNLEINQLTSEYMFRPGENLFGRVTGGYLEAMFGGISAEMLWFPIDSRLAMGVELNYVRLRDFDMLLGFQSYDVLTGHGSVYYDFGNGFTTQVDVGRYLAGDWGSTFSLSREFNNGFKIGGFFTLTEVPFSEFGEGSFDRGLRIEIPVSWFTGKSSRRTYKQVIRPLQRDGGARLNVSNRLYDVTRDYRATQLSNSWGLVFQ